MQPLDFNTLKKEKTFFSLLLILIMGFLLRIYNLGSASLWIDELRTIGRITSPFSQIINGLSTFPLPPLYYILTHVWVKAFGISEFSLRFPSLLFSVLSIILIFKLSKELFGRQTGLLAALLLSVFLYNIDYAREAKMYAMVWFFGLLSFHFFYKFTRDNKIRDLILYTVSTEITIYTLYAGFLFIIIQNVAFFLFFFNVKQLKKWLAAQMILILLYLPWIGFLIHTAMNRAEIGWIPKGINYLQSFFNLFCNLRARTIGWIPKKINYLQSFFQYALAGTITTRPVLRLINAGIICIYVFLFVSAFIRPNKKRGELTAKLIKNEYFLLVWIILPLLAFYLIHIFVFPILVVRYIAFIHFPFIILCSKGLNKYSAKIKYPLLILLLYLTFSCQLYPYYKSNAKLYITYYQQDWRGLFKRINAEKGDNALVTTVKSASGKSKYLESKYFYFCKGIKAIKYYNNGQEIPELTRQELEECIRDKKYDSIFVIYRGTPEIDGVIKGYRLEKKVEEGFMGYLWFKRLQEYPGRKIQN